MKKLTLASLITTSILAYANNALANQSFNYTNTYVPVIENMHTQNSNSNQQPHEHIVLFSIPEVSPRPYMPNQIYFEATIEYLGVDGKKHTDEVHITPTTSGTIVNSNNDISIAPNNFAFDYYFKVMPKNVDSISGAFAICG
ncbi:MULTISPECIES: hypothetical protein [Cysteiniphilum]|uniref:Uncharacterized protein n=1 Tax=Cysteiniphilum litorale TaxID=2056700 RepID=A0A8J2Z701_9GAMM|nr:MULTISPECIES: hypothetical protein [Cysteiniphilum]GGG07222.1 hypothetical protein GCM10010995_25940 [Cysteiniphilum litorale]